MGGYIQIIHLSPVILSNSEYSDAKLYEALSVFDFSDFKLHTNDG